MPTRQDSKDTVPDQPSPATDTRLDIADPAGPSRVFISNRFMKRMTAILTIGNGIPFLILYLVEGILLYFNEVDVMSPTIQRYVLYDEFRESFSHQSAYDLSCWFVDIKKQIAYSLLCLWFGFWALFVKKSGQVTAFNKGPYLPFSVSILIACGLVYSLATAVQWPKSELSTSILTWLPWTLPPLSTSHGFVAYRLFWPVVLLLMLTHWVIGIQILLRYCRRITDGLIFRYILLIAVPVLFVIWVHILARNITDDLYRDTMSFRNALLIAGMVITSVLILFAVLRNPTGEIPSDTKAMIQFLLGARAFYIVIALMISALPFAPVALGINPGSENYKLITPYVICLNAHVNSSPSSKRIEKIIEYDEKVRAAISGKFIPSLSAKMVNKESKEIADIYIQLSGAEQSAPDDFRDTLIEKLSENEHRWKNL